MSDLDMEKLEAIFWGDQREQPTRVRLERVVKALRDEICHGYAENSARDLANEFNRILGDAENEKVAGGSTREDGQAAQPGCTTPATPKDEEYFGVTVGREFPATDPAPACEWWVERDPDGEGHYETGCGAGWCLVVGLNPSTDGYQWCPSCGKPIKFTEAK